MKKIHFSAMLFAGLLTLGISVSSCSNEDDLSAVSTRAANSITVSGVLTGTHNWSGTVNLDGKVFLKDGTINIAAGTNIVGLAKSGEGNASALIITKTGKINAVGTPSSPIVFTSANESSIWGGLVILSTGAINQSEAQTIEGITAESVPAGVDITYGTPAQGKSDSEIDAINNVSSGTLRYVRVERAGQEIGEGNELNAFTFGAVGHGTTVEYCQAYYGEDDGFEFFGGDVNCKYLVSTATDDDAFDFDFGYRGNIQFAVATLNASLECSSDPNGIECDNENPYNPAHTPYTRPVLSNLTIVGTPSGSAANVLKSAANFRRGTEFVLANSILYGYPTGLLCETNNASNSIFTHNVISVSNGGTAISDDGFDGTENSIVTPDGIVLGSPWGNYKLAASLRPTDDPAKTGADFSALDGWFTTTTYKGAVAPTGINWLTQNWIK